jgi:hypothetical protein
MVPTVGQYSNYSNLLLYSNCSINSFKMKLLSPDKRFLNTNILKYFSNNFFSKSNVLPAGKCLLNIPESNYPPTSHFPGALWSHNDQCQLIFGINSSYTPCQVMNVT